MERARTPLFLGLEMRAASALGFCDAIRRFRRTAFLISPDETLGIRFPRPATAKRPAVARTGAAARLRGRYLRQFPPPGRLHGFAH